MSEDSLKRKAVSSVKWNTVATIFVTVVQILRLSVLTRLLDVSDFGLIAIATMVIGFTDIFSELGLTVAIIHEQNITQKQYSSVYWTNIILSIFVFTFLWIVTPLISEFYDNTILNTIIPLLGIQILLNGFGKLFQTIKSKKLEYVFISKVRIYSALVGFFVTIILALLGMGIYSLVLGQLSQVTITQGVYFIVGRRQQKILWHLDFREIYGFIKIGVYRLGSQILDFFASRIDILLIGKFFGMDDLGIYNLAKDLIVKPFSILNTLTSNVAAAAFAKIQQSLILLSKYYSKIVNIVSVISIPIYLVIFIAADIIVVILYGSEHIEVAILLRILTFYGIECTIDSQGNILQISLGRTDIGFKWTLIRIICSILVIVAVSRINIIAVAYGQFILSIVSIYLFWRIVISPLIHIGFSGYTKSFISPLIVGALMAIPLYVISGLNKSIWIQIPLAVFFIGGYALYYFIFKRSYLVEIAGLIKNKKV